MTLTKLLDNLRNLKVKKVRGENLWRVIDINMSDSWDYVAEFPTKKEAEEFKTRRAFKRFQLTKIVEMI